MSNNLEERIWEMVKNGSSCPNCGKKVSGRQMFRQWKRNYRFLCQECETIQELKEGGYKNLKPSKIALDR